METANLITIVLAASTEENEHLKNVFDGFYPAGLKVGKKHYKQAEKAIAIYHNGNTDATK